MYCFFSLNRGTLAFQFSCAPRCGADAYYRAEDKKFAERWMTGWAWLCFLSTLFTLLTFWVEPSRFRYPERPIVFLALCYGLLSVAYIVRGTVGAEHLSCASQADKPDYVPVSVTRYMTINNGFLNCASACSHHLSARNRSTTL